MNPTHDPRRDLPSVDALMRHPDVASLVGSLSRDSVTRLARRGLASVRDRAQATISDGALAEPLPRDRLLGEAVTATLAEAAAIANPGPRRVINASGVVLHTNLGRAPLSAHAAAAVAAVSAGYANLEFDLGTGERGARHAHLAGPVLDALEATHPGLDTSGLDALVVNNCAGAILLVLAELARGREVVVSRGHLVEIGGGFRVPDVMRQGGARLVEVGTTNRTRLEDYANAIGPDTAALLAVHPSNFRIIGFGASVAIADLASLGAERGVPVVEDVGSGCLLDTEMFNIGGALREPRPSESLAAGVSVVTFSGDKLLGGPQAGIIVGRRPIIERIRRHPLARALRLGSLGIVALAATLTHYRRGTAATEVPVWLMIGATEADLSFRASSWAASLRASGVACHVAPEVSAIGGGSMPGVSLPTTVVRIPAGAGSRAAALAARLRRGDAAVPPVVGRIADDDLLIDPRTVLPGEDDAVVAAVARASRATSS